jgi:hypothetical protein
MTIEKAFAIDATPEAIWEALWADLAEGDESRYRVEGSSWPRRLSLDVDLSGVRCNLTYVLTPMDQPGMTEVAANLAPLSKRYGLYFLLTFGHIRRNYEMLLVSGLANLKAHVEGTAAG